MKSSLKPGWSWTSPYVQHMGGQSGSHKSLFKFGFLEVLLVR